MADRKAFNRICKELDQDKPLTFEMIGEVFGTPFNMLLVYALLDAQDAARAIQGAINRLKAGGVSEEEIQSVGEEVV